MGLVIKNIVSSIKGYKRIYLTMIASQIISVMLLFLTYGIFGSFNLSQKEYELEQKHIWAYFEDNVYIEELKPVLLKLLEETEAKLDYFFVMGIVDYESGVRISIYNEYKEGSLSYSNTIKKNTTLLQGRYPTDYEMDSGAHVAVSSTSHTVGSVVSVAGKEYEVIGMDENTHDDKLTVSLNAVPEGYQFQMVALNFNKFPTIEDYEFFKYELEKEFGSRVKIGKFEAVDIEQIIAMKSIVVISIIVGIVAALDTALLYGYLMEKRKKQIAIMGIMGAKRIHRVLINEIEIMLITVITSVIGLTLFKFIFENLVHKMYENIMEIYYPKVYLIMFGIYIVSVLLVTSVVTISKSGNKFLQLRKSGK